MSLDLGADLFPMLGALLAAVSCGLLGNFLVLRRLSLMGDAISHSVLPGLVAAFLITTTRSPVAMLIGAGLSGLITVLLVEVVKRLGRVEPGAAMGVVFSILFALGVLLIERAAARQTDIDPDCVLYGQLESSLAWFDAPQTWDQALRLETWTGSVIPETVDPATGATLIPADTREGIPRQIITLAVVCLVSAVFVVTLFKELRIAAFDAALATTQGFSSGLLHTMLMVLVAAATVASFEAVGSILVIAMLICPAATARLMTDRLRTQLVWSVAFAAAAAVPGYLAASAVPALFHAEPVNAAGSITVAAGILLVAVILLSPRHGVLGRQIRRRALARAAAMDHLLAAAHSAGGSLEGSHARPHRAVQRRALAAGLVEGSADRVVLTRAGVAAAAEVVGRRQEWESYLVQQVGIQPDHTQSAAEQLEHLPPPPA